ncbi:hypothetical protein N0O52_004947, partial [Escherichia coli]|nr:hypothetical protein [Escherichia coli]
NTVKTSDGTNGNDINASAVYLNGTNTLNASRGNITISGNNTGYNNYYSGADSIAMTGNISMTAANISINGSTSNSTATTGQFIGSTKGIHFEGGNFTFTGNTTITGTAIVGPGVGFRHTNNISFNNGTAVINASNTGNITSVGGYVAAFGGTAPNYGNNTINFTLQNANLSINASSINGRGIAGTGGINSTINISGTGNASLNGTSNNSAGIAYIDVNASGLNGTATMTGTSTNDTGVLLQNNNLNNVTIT